MRKLELPWWTRAVLATAAGALVGVLAAAVFRGQETKFAAIKALAVVVFGNLALADLGRRRFSIRFVLGAGIPALLLFAIDYATGATLGTIILGGLIARRLAAPGLLQKIRRDLLFIVGAAIAPFATLGAIRLAQAAATGAPLALGLAAYHAFFWFPVSGAEAALAWSAARAAERRRRPPPPDLPFGDDLVE